MKARKKSSKKSLKRPVEVADESEAERVGNEDELANNENQSPNFAASSTSLKQESPSTKAKRRKVPDGNSDDSVKENELEGSSSLETKPEHDNNITNPELVDKVQVNPDKIARSPSIEALQTNIEVPENPDKIVRSPSIEALQTNFEKIELTKSDSLEDNATQLDLSVDKETELVTSHSNPETTAENQSQENEHTNASEVETVALIGFAELSLDFAETDEQLEVPEIVENRDLKTPEIPDNYKGNLKLSAPSAMEDSVPGEVSEMHNHSTREEWEAGYVNQNNTTQYNEEETVKGNGEPISEYAQEECGGNIEVYEEATPQYEHEYQEGDADAHYEGGYELGYGANANTDEYGYAREEYEGKYQERREPLPQYEEGYQGGEEGAQYEGPQYEGAQYEGAQYEGAQYEGTQYEGAQYEGGYQLGYGPNENTDEYQYAREQYEREYQERGEPIPQYEEGYQEGDEGAQYEGGYKLGYGANENSDEYQYAREKYAREYQEGGEPMPQYEVGYQGGEGVAQYEGGYELGYAANENFEYESAREEYEREYQEGEEPIPQHEEGYQEGEELAQYEGADNLGYAANENVNQYETTGEDYEEEEVDEEVDEEGDEEGDEECDEEGAEECDEECDEEGDELEYEDNSTNDDCEEATSQSEEEVEEEQSAQSEEDEADEDVEDAEEATSQSEEDVEEEEVEEEESANEEAESEQESEPESLAEEEAEDEESESAKFSSESAPESEEEGNKEEDVGNIDNNEQLKIETSEEVGEAKIKYKAGEAQQFVEDLKTDENSVLENKKENTVEESTIAHSENVQESKESTTTSKEALNETLCSKEVQNKSGESNKESCNDIINKPRTALSGESEAIGGIKQVDNLQSRESDKLLVSKEHEKETKKTSDSKRAFNSDLGSDSFSSISFGHSEGTMSSHSPTMKVEGFDVDLNSISKSQKKSINNKPTEGNQDEKVTMQSNEKHLTSEGQVKEPLYFIAKAMQMMTPGANKPNNSVNEEKVEGLSSSVIEKKTKFEKKMTNFPIKTPQKSTDKEQKPATAADIVFPTVIVKESDSDDSNWQRKPKALKTESNSGKDFFEDESTYEEEKINSEDDEEEIRPNAAPSFVVALSDYEVMFNEIRKLAGKVPNRHKYELHNLLFPIMAIGYLRMIYNGKYRKGKTFVENSQRYLDHSYMARIEKLIGLQSGANLPKKARRLLADDNEHLGITMYADTYRVLVIHMKSWSRTVQQTFARHFDLVSDNNISEPRQHAVIGSPAPEKIFWANPESLKEKKENSPPSRRKRFKNFKPSPTRNVNLPTCTRLFTPTPKRWDLEQIKEDEERRVPLNRENLPSAYLYTAIEHVETVICAAFSNNLTMLSIGTNCSTIHVYSLTSSKLVHIKPADYLKNLDTGMSGIDESMLDASKKKMRRTLVGHQGPVYGCTFAPHDRFLLSCAHDRTVRCWCLLSWSCVVIYPGHASAVYSVCYAPLGYYFATVSDDRTARVWVQDNKKSLCILVGHLAEVICCIFHPNRHYLATGSGDCTVRMWDIVKAVQVRVFSGHREPVNTLAYSICGRYLVSGADDKYIVVWDTEKDQLVRALSHHTEAVNCLQFAMDNKLFVAGGQDCQLSIWDFERIIQEYETEQVKPANSSSKPEKVESKPGKVDSKPGKVESKPGKVESKPGKVESTPGNVESEPPEESIQQRSSEVLIQSYPSKGTPFYMLHITRRNLLLGFCVQRAEEIDKESGKQTGYSEAKYREWREFLDILKLKACFSNRQQQQQQNGEAEGEAEVKEEDEEEDSSSDQELEAENSAESEIQTN